MARGYDSSYILKNQETMNKRSLFYLLLFCGVLSVSAQETIDAELKNLISVVSNLRQSDVTKQKAAFERVKADLQADDCWTPMDELRRDPNECLAIDKNVARFRLNTILNGIQRDRDKRVGAKQEMLSGEDLNYNYSLLEKSVKGQQKVSYSFRGREGRQTFVLVPFQTDADFTATLRCGDKTLGSAKRESDGNYYLRTTHPLKLTDQLVLEITNKGAASQSFIILNHNTRSK